MAGATDYGTYLAIEKKIYFDHQFGYKIDSFPSATKSGVEFGGWTYSDSTDFQVQHANRANITDVHDEDNSINLWAYFVEGGTFRYFLKPEGIELDPVKLVRNVGATPSLPTRYSKDSVLLDATSIGNMYYPKYYNDASYYGGGEVVDFNFIKFSTKSNVPPGVIVEDKRIYVPENTNGDTELWVEFDRNYKIRINNYNGLGTYRDFGPFDYSFVFAFIRNQISWSEFKTEFNKLNMSQKLKVPFVYCGSMIQDFGYIIREVFSITVPILLLACLGYVAWSLMLQYFF